MLKCSTSRDTATSRVRRHPQAVLRLPAQLFTIASARTAVLDFPRSDLYLEATVRLYEPATTRLNRLSQLSVFVSLFRHSSDGLAQLTNEWRQTMAKNVICLWYDGTAEEAARFYAQTFPDSAVTAVHRAPGDYPDGKQGQVLTVEFTVVGVPCLGLNGGPAFKHSEAFSFQIVTEDQAETDRYWNSIVGNGGAESACGWCKDKWGLSWQITPRVLLEATTDSDRAAAKRAFDAMMKMKKIDIATIEAARRGPARA